MNILLTGGAGFIGSHTCVELINAGHNVIIVDNFSNSHSESIKRVERITNQKIPLAVEDVCDKDAMRRVFAKHTIDAVIHFAGLKAVGESVTSPLEYYRNNLDSTLTLCEVMKEYDVKKFVFSSSATVYGMSDKVPLDENIPTGCASPYGWTKYMNEQILKDVAFANPDWSVILLRYFNPVGAHNSGMIGENPNGIPSNIMPYICQVASGKLEMLHVFGNDYPTPDGTGVRDYIHVVDLARGHVAACEYAENHTGVEVINLGTGVGYSVFDIVHTFEKVNGIKIPYVINSRRPGDIAVSYADVSKALRVLGWKAEMNLEDMCRDAWRWQSKNPNGYGG